jgi:hypothetical protein
VNVPRTERFPTGPLALAAAILGAGITLLLRIDPLLNPDSLAFLALAESVVAGGGLQYQEPLIPGLDLFAFRAPGYPLFLALGLLLGGITTVVAVQGALNGLSAVLLGAVVQRLGGGVPAAWIAFAIRLAWPTAWYHSGLLLSEVLYEFLNVFATWLVLEAIRRREARWTIVAGAATAFSILCRPVGLGLALALGIWLLVKFRRAAFIYAAAALLAWIPWPVRNARVLHAAVPFTTNGGATMWAGTTDGDVRPAYDWMGANVHLGEIGFDAHFRELAETNIRRDPGAFVEATLARGFIYLGPIRGRAFDLWLHRFAMLGALAGVLLAVSRRRLLLPAMNWVFQGALMLPIFLIDRYRFPTEWCVIAAAALGIEALAGRVGVRRAALWSAGALALCVAGSFALSRG